MKTKDIEYLKLRSEIVKLNKIIGSYLTNIYPKHNEEAKEAMRRLNEILVTLPKNHPITENLIQDTLKLLISAIEKGKGLP